MKKTSLISCFCFACVMLLAQTPDSTKHLLTTNVNSLGLSSLTITDPYLSPSAYTGTGLQYGHERRRLLSSKTLRFSMQEKLNLNAGRLLNPVGSSSMAYLGTDFGWGINYHFRIRKGFQILVGGLWNFDCGIKYVARNVNNPVNLDLATNLNATSLLLYDIHLRRRTLRLEASLQSPVLGYMFVPLGGASYYEMFELGNLDNAFHTSSLHNKTGLTQAYTLNFPFNKSVWRIGIRLNNLKYKANDMVFVRKEYSFVIGTTFDAIRFGGRRKSPPQNFISPNE